MAKEKKKKGVVEKASASKKKKKKSAAKKSASEDKKMKKSSARDKKLVNTPVRDENYISFGHQFAVILIAVIGLFITICFIFPDKVGVVGSGLANYCFFGLFGLAAYLVPLLFLQLALFWKRDVLSGAVRYKYLISFGVLLFSAVIVHTFRSLALKEVYSFETAFAWENLKELYLGGINAPHDGGGFLGGILAIVMICSFGYPGTLIFGFLFLIALLMGLFGLTPSECWQRFLFYRERSKNKRMLRKQENERKRAEREARKAEEEKAKAEAAEEEDSDEEEESDEEEDFDDEEDSVDEEDEESEENGEDDGETSEDGEESEDDAFDMDEESEEDAANADETETEVEESAPVFESVSDSAKQESHTSVKPESTSSGKPEKTENNGVSDKTETPKKIQQEVIDEQMKPSSVQKAEASSVIAPAAAAEASVKPKTLAWEPDEQSEPAENEEESEEVLAEESETEENANDEIMILPPDPMVEALAEEDEEIFEEPAQPAVYEFPPIDILCPPEEISVDESVSKELRENADKIIDTLESFHVHVKISHVSRGPTVTRYELEPAAGTRVRSITNLLDDIALSLATSGVRSDGIITGKSAIGIEVPNNTVNTVYIRELIEDERFTDAKSRLTTCLGMDVSGAPVYLDIAKMPHLLIAGATGMGKSVCINSLLVSLLYKARPDEVKLILIDPKKVELNIYNGIPHLLVPVVFDPKKAAGSLHWAVTEMERRFELIEAKNTRNIAQYNAAVADDPTQEVLPQIVIIIDELADLMMSAPDDVEASICRLAQKARAAGMHLIIGTQRPSVDVITGLIKANIPSRIAFTVASQIDSRTIIDTQGAEKLIGRGDMLYSPVGSPKPIRVQGSFVSETEIEEIVGFIRDQSWGNAYSDDVMAQINKAAELCGQKKGKGGAVAAAEGDGDDFDPMLDSAVALAVESGKISTSLIQRRLSLGYGRAAKIVDIMERKGIVGPSEGQKPRTVLITREQYLEMQMNKSDDGASFEDTSF